MFLSRDLDLWPFDPKIDGFSGLIVEHNYVYAKFGDPICVGFWDIVQKNSQENSPTPLKTTIATG